MKNTIKIVTVLGPTSSGKTALAVKLAKKFNGEIISADSRQVYRGMDIGTGKDLAEYGRIKYHLIDVADPRKQFDLSRYQKLAREAIQAIIKKGKLPIIAGGTGLYLQALLDGYNLPPVKPDEKIRKVLEKKTVAQLFSQLKKLNPKFASKINHSDRQNKRRLIRYIEVAREPKAAPAKNKPDERFEFLVIGLECPREELNKRIYKRLIYRLEKEDMVGEVKRLRKQGLSWKRLENFGLEYKYISLYLQGKLEYDEMVEKLFIAIRQFAKKQMTWFRRWERQGRKISWVSSTKTTLASPSFFRSLFSD